MYNVQATVEYEKEANQLEDTQMEWSSIIFVPFHPVFKFLVLISVVIKCMLGPLQAVHPIVYCTDAMDDNSILTLIKYYYWYGCDTVYGADTFLHIVHRQVTDKAMRREYLPKSAFLILLDLVSLVPLFRLMETNVCPDPKVWPNILAFNEFCVIYRVLEHFTLARTHSYAKMCIGYTIILITCLNCVTCFWLLLTYQGLCDHCADHVYDWRGYIEHKLNESNLNYTTYMYGSAYIITYAINKAFDGIKPNTVMEFKMTCFFLVCGYVLFLFVLLPKGFSESILRLRMICERYPDVKKYVQETRRRHSSPKASKHVETFYVLMWKKRDGITKMPDVMTSMPRYIKLEVRQDLVWQLYYHSPTLRKTSNPYKRWLCDKIKLEFKLPGDKFYAAPHSHTNLYFIKNGVVQLISSDDGVTPILSFTGGTILGDVNFLVPPRRKDNRMICLTYCELLYLERKDLLKSLQLYRNDRAHIMKQTKERLDHARTLYACKQHIRGLERAEDQGISWIIKRWWEISKFINSWKKRSSKASHFIRCDIPPEETIYHCAKYIGQLVLSTEEQLQTKSMFVNVQFPWILTPDSVFIDVWQRVVFVTVFIVLIVYPPYLTRAEMPQWFGFLQYWTDFVYVSDTFISLLTSLPEQEQDEVIFSTVMFARFKSYKFILDVLSAIWTEHIVVFIGLPDYYKPVQFNRLLKTYVLFYGKYLQMDIRRKPAVNVTFKVVLTLFVVLYISSYVLYELHKRFSQMTSSYFFGTGYCGKTPEEYCDPAVYSVFGPFIFWIFEVTFLDQFPNFLHDIFIAVFNTYITYLIFIYCKTKYVACLYLKYRDVVSYQNFVVKLKDYYVHHQIHRDLLARLERYLECHWNYFKGTDVINPNIVTDEPHDVCWRVQGEVAAKIIGESKAFIGADPALVHELAHAAQLMILPSGSSIVTFGAQCKNVTWVVQGCIKCEYHDEKGELLKIYYDSGVMLSVSSVFLGKASLRSYISETDCEILYIRVKDFFNIIKRYENEWSYYETCMEELQPGFDKMFHDYVLKHKDYQSKLRSRLYSTRMSTMIAPGSRMISDMIEDEYRSSPFEGEFWGDPNTKFMQRWLLFRAITVIVSITCSVMQGTIGATYRWHFIMMGGFCNCIAYIDITMKLFLGYYNKEGLLITDRRLCLMHYLTRGFVLDAIGALPMRQMLASGLAQGVNINTAMLFGTICQFAHLYIVSEYFNYISDTPVVNKSLILIIKWQVLNIMLMFGVCHFLTIYCVDFTYDSKYNIANVERLNSCWVPKYLKIDPTPTLDQLHLIFIESFNLAQSGFMMTNIGTFYIDRDYLEIGFVLISLGIVWWYITCYTLTLMILGTRGNTLFQYSVHQLKGFLEGERVEKELIKRAVSYFRYNWMRTKGVQIHPLTYERIGVVFRQDLSYYFFRRTFMALDTILGGGEALVRQLASVSTQIYFLPGQEILREMDVSHLLFIVHRGKVILTKDGDRVINLVKGCIFGQLEGTETRPIKVTVTADEYVDLLQITIKQFQEIITDQVRKTIANSTQAKYDFMAARKVFPENPYDTVQYILRGRKTIQLPRMRKPVEARTKSWYFRWLFLAWFMEPFCSSIIVILLGTLPHTDATYRLYCVLGVLDIIHFCTLVSEFFTIIVDVEDNKCVKRLLGSRYFKHWGLYVDAVSLLSPLLTIATDDWKWQLARVLRLRLLYSFHVHFCTSFKSNLAPILMKIMILCLLLHGFSCGWIYVACRNDEFPIEIPNISDEMNSSINYNEWVQPNMRKGGCPRMAKDIIKEDGTFVPTFVVAKHWHNDYIVALTYVLLMHRQIPMESVTCLSIKEVYYKVIMTFFLFLIDIWVMSIAINTIYAKFRELYYYDFNVINLVKYLTHNGLSPILSEAVETYTKQLWKRQGGNWLPELVNLAPHCLREDLFDSLYMYHLDIPPIYQNIPAYFKRQMAARIKRIVIFPGKCIVREGDRFPCSYFIHEGEVEKWFTDTTGESRFQSLLYTNGYFGIVPGLIKMPFQFSYYTRTVVDLVYLKLEDWEDLLDSYPDIKEELEDSARQVKRSLTKQKYGKSFSAQGVMEPDPYMEQQPFSGGRIF